MHSGFALASKPVGVTSFARVQVARAELGALPRPPKLSHGGTLDPFAHGLLVLMVGPANRLMSLLHPLPKTYVAQVRWGLETDTGDGGGVVVHRGSSVALTPERLDAALAPFLGWQAQTPPPTSAKKLQGEPAYKKAHRGEPVMLPPSQVYLHQARWLTHALPETSTLELVCRGGYYVRALARDLGRALGCGAHLTSLHRPRIGPWEEPLSGALQWVPGSDSLPWCRTRALSDHERGALRRGQPIPPGEVRAPRWRPPSGYPEWPAPIAALHQGRLVALLEARDGGWAATVELGHGLGTPLVRSASGTSRS